MFKYIHTFLGLDYRDAFLIALYFVVLESAFQKLDQSYDNTTQKKLTNGHSGIDY